MIDLANPGRPPGRVYPHVRTVKMNDADVERLRELTALHETSESEILRVALREKWRRDLGRKRGGAE